MRTCDVIIPVYNSAASLPLALEALSTQAIPPDWHIQLLICDDGSSDNTYEKLHITNYTLPITYLPGKHAGVAAARNRGIAASTADLLLFLGADILLRPRALMAHLLFHERCPDAKAAALGFVRWDPRLAPTPLMEWMTHGGLQNNFDDLLGRATADTEEFFYGSHLSLKRSVLATTTFSEDYRTYGFEDRDLGRRLVSSNVTLHVLHQAVGLHRHLYSADAFFKRQIAVGASQQIFCRRFHLPDPRSTQTWRHWLQQALYRVGPGQILRGVVRYVASRYATPRLFAHAVNYEYRRGLYAKDEGVLHTEYPSYPQVFPQSFHKK